MNSNEKDFLKFYMEQTWEEMRHVENLREKVTVIVVTVSTAIVGFVIQQKFAVETKPLIVFVIVLGIFGLLMVMKLYHIHQRDQKRLDKWYKYYESACGDNPQTLFLRDEADLETGEAFSPISKLKHHYFWSTIHLFVAVAGIFLLITSYPEQKSIHPNTTSKTKSITAAKSDSIKRK